MNPIKLRAVARDAAILILVVAAASGTGQLLAAGWKKWNEVPATEPFVAADIDGIDRDGVTMIASSTCPACAGARQWLRARRIDYRELTVDTSAEARRIAEQIDVRVVPTFLFDGVRVNGFIASELQARLASAPSTSAEAGVTN